MLTNRGGGELRVCVCACSAKLASRKFSHWEKSWPGKGGGKHVFDDLTTMTGRCAASSYAQSVLSSMCEYSVLSTQPVSFARHKEDRQVQLVAILIRLISTRVCSQVRVFTLAP